MHALLLLYCCIPAALLALDWRSNNISAKKNIKKNACTAPSFIRIVAIVAIINNYINIVHICALAQRSRMPALMLVSGGLSGIQALLLVSVKQQ